MTTVEQRQDEVDPLDREFAPGWAPEPGDKIRGKLIQRDERDGGFGAYPIYTLALADGHPARIGGGIDVLEEVAVHASRDVLRRKLANARLELGDDVGIKYQGPPQGTARSYRYRVIKFNPDGSYIDVSYATEDGSQVVDEAEAATQEALETERDARDAAMSTLHAPLES